MYIVFDTETTGLPANFDAPISDTDNWPRVVQLAWQIHDDMGGLILQKDFIIKPVGYNVPFKAESLHGISTELADLLGEDMADVLRLFKSDLAKADLIGQLSFFLSFYWVSIYGDIALFWARLIKS